MHSPLSPLNFELFLACHYHYSSHKFVENVFLLKHTNIRSAHVFLWTIMLILFYQLSLSVF